MQINSKQTASKYFLVESNVNKPVEPCNIFIDVAGSAFKISKFNTKMKKRAIKKEKEIFFLEKTIKEFNIQYYK